MFRYLSGTVHHSLLLKPVKPIQKVSIRAYSDFDWASDPDGKRSPSGSCVYFGPNIISWSSKKQSLFVRSSSEEEYRSLPHITYELLWIESLLAEFHVQFQVPTLLYDNISVMMVSYNSIIHARTKHIELDIHFVRQRVATNKLLIEHIPGTMQIADALIKPLSHTSFQDFKVKLRVAPLLQL